eukprot:6907722-Heterocapsa_arctica.AAC.2
MQSDCAKPKEGMIEMDTDKAKPLIDLVKAETTAMGIFMSGVGQSPSPSGKPPKQHIGPLHRRKGRPGKTIHKFQRKPVVIPCSNPNCQQLAALHRYSAEVVQDQETEFPIPEIETISSHL